MYMIGLDVAHSSKIFQFLRHQDPHWSSAITKL